MRRLVLLSLLGLVTLAALGLSQEAPPPTPTPIPTGQVRATIEVTGADRKAVPGVDAVLWLPGLRAPAGASVPRLSMSSREKRFDPRVLAVQAGTTVTFPNHDRIYHNVFSLSQTARFDLGLYRNGASKTWRFEKPGVVNVYCNIHPQMAAYLVVVDSPYLGQAGKDGVAFVPSVPVGRHAIRVWDEKGGGWSGTVDVLPAATATVRVALDGSAWKQLPHKNKHGKDYPPPDDDENRY